MTSLILGIIGIFVELLAAVMLFSQITGLKPVPMLTEVTNQSHTAFDLYKHAIATINDSIKHANALNEQAHNKAKIWIAMIFLGALLQILSAILAHCQID